MTKKTIVLFAMMAATACFNQAKACNCGNGTKRSEELAARHLVHGNTPFMRYRSSVYGEKDCQRGAVWRGAT